MNSTKPTMWVFAALMLTANGVAAQAPTMSAVRQVVRIPAAAPEGLSELIFQATGSGLAAGGLPKLKSEPPNIEFGDPIELTGATSQRRMWRVPVTIRGLPAAGTSAVHTATVTWNDAAYAFPYIVSNAAVPAVTWKVTGVPTEVKVASQWCQSIRIGATGARVTGLVVTSTLVEQSTKHPLNALTLAVRGSTDGAALEAAVNDGTGGIELCLADSSPKPGKYMGTVNVSAAEKPEGDPQSVTVYVSDGNVRGFGAFLLAFGCLLAYALRVLAPTRLAQRQALLAAAVVREQALTLLSTLAVSPAPLTTSALELEIGKLEKSALIKDGLIPPDVPLPFGSSGDAARFKARLEESAGAVSRLAIVAKGVRAAEQHGGANLATVLAALDAIGESAATLTTDVVTARVQSALTGLGLPLPAPGSAAASPGSQQLMVQISEVSSFVWVGMVFLTWITGLFVLVLNNPGFGVPMDYLYCLVWGFGLPVVGQQLTGASASTALGITVPPTRS